ASPCGRQRSSVSAVSPAALVAARGQGRVRCGEPLADFLFRNAARAGAFATLVVLLGILVSLAIAAWPALEAFGPAFLWRSEWDPPAGRFGALVPIYGTLVTSFIAIAIAVPV